MAGVALMGLDPSKGISSSSRFPQVCAHILPVKQDNQTTYANIRTVYKYSAIAKLPVYETADVLAALYFIVTEYVGGDVTALREFITTVHFFQLLSNISMQLQRYRIQINN